MGAYKCARHGIQGFAICCEHVADAIDTGAALGTDVSRVEGYLFARCRGCVNAGLMYNPEQTPPAIACAACYGEWTAATARPRSC